MRIDRTLRAADAWVRKSREVTHAKCAESRIHNTSADSRGGNVQAANLIQKVAPIYPPEAKAAGIQGTVQFTAVIAKSGVNFSLQP
jgi:outer membrane biosynthesis protein TonB